MVTEGRDAKEVALEVISRFESFIKDIGVQTRLSECEVPQNEIDKIVEDVVRTAFSADGVLPARVPVSCEEVKQILGLSY